DLWNVCNGYGTVVDVFIPAKKSKIGKRFAFVRFNKVQNMNRLIENLNTIWMGRYHLFVNPVRFERSHKSSTFNQKDGTVVNNIRTGHHNIDHSIPKEKFKENGRVMNSKSYVNVLNNESHQKKENYPPIVLDETYMNTSNYSLALMGKVIEFSALTNLKMVLANEGFESINLKYLGGFLTIMRTSSSDEEFNNEDNLDENGNLNNGSKMEDDSDLEEVPETIFEKQEPSADEKGDKSDNQVNPQSEDPFNIYDIRNKKNETNLENSKVEESLNYPPGFTPDKDINAQINSPKGLEMADDIHDSNENMEVASNVIKKNSGPNNSKVGSEKSVCSGYFKKDFITNSGGSFLQVMKELFKVGQTMGYNMEGCEWIPSGKKTLMISIYAPQDIRDKKMLWEYLSLVISNWKEDVIVMGDFNEVRSPNERYGSVFNPQGANIFNQFISTTGLEEIPLGSCKYTWCHKSGTKMSKLDRFLVSDGLWRCYPDMSSITLDRFLSNHMPILMRESHHDYGPIPFRFYHFWFDLDDFDKFVEDTWMNAPLGDTNAMVKFSKKLRYLKQCIHTWIKDYKLKTSSTKQQIKEELSKIDVLIDKGEGSLDICSKRRDIFKSLQELEKLHSLELSQKTKVKWAIGGDENSKYFHGVLNKNRNQNSIRGILVDGDWIEIPSLVKNEFLSYFSNRFDRPPEFRLQTNSEFPNKLSPEQQSDLENIVTRSEIKKAAWECGTDKSPGPDGFTFGFFQRYWSVLENDVVEAVNTFFNNGNFPKGIHGNDRNLRRKVSNQHPSLWLDIIKEVNLLQNRGIGLISFFQTKMGNGEETLFWDDKWRGDITLKTSFPCVYLLETQKNITVAHKLSHSELYSSFRRMPGSGIEEAQYNLLTEFVQGDSLTDAKDCYR
nr:RNA-directed DNA polymerase, eukaryota [Tanacetum cinerariifolium]